MPQRKRREEGGAVGRSEVEGGWRLKGGAGRREEGGGNLSSTNRTCHGVSIG